MATIIATARQIEGNIEEILFKSPEDRAAYETALQKFKKDFTEAERGWFRESLRIEREQGAAAADAYYNKKYFEMGAKRPKIIVVNDENYQMFDMDNPHLAGWVKVEISL